MRKRPVIIIMCMILFLTGCSIDLGGLSGEREVEVPDVLLNEVVSSNKFALTTSEGETPDFVELYNPTDERINLEGYGLSDKTDNPYLFTFPEVYIEAHGYMLVYCVGKEDLSNPDGVLRTGFNISSQGETIVLSEPGNSASFLLSVPEMQSDMSYGLSADGGYYYYATPTPLEVNEGMYSDTPDFSKVSATPASLVINELMTNNTYNIADAQGDREDWVEIKNTGAEPLNLINYALTDDEQDPKKWLFPNYELAPGGVVVVHLSGKDGVSTEIHASFSLSNTDAGLWLVSPEGNILDTVANETLNGSISTGRDANDPSVWTYYAIPTPGTDNLTTPSSKEIAEKYLPTVFINEVKGSGEQTDWLELKNSGTEAIDLTGYGLSDTRDDFYLYPLDGMIIEPGGFLVLEVFDPEVGETDTLPNVRNNLSFNIAGTGENLYLTNTQGIVVDHFNSGLQTGTISSGRAVGGDNTRLFFSESTKGAENTATSYTGYATEPVIHTIGGYTQAGSAVEITGAPGETVYYTLDGSEPNETSAVYASAITINDTTPLRAVAYSPGKLPSPVATQTYLVGVTHEVPVVFITMNPDDFSGYENGIYADGPGYSTDVQMNGFIHKGANYWQDWEKEMNFAFHEADGTKGVSFDAGISIFGQFSREEQQKSFAIQLRGEYGQNNVTYPFFRDYEYTNFSSLILRTSGQDWTRLKFATRFSLRR